MSITIKRKPPLGGKLEAWIDNGELYVRETCNHGRDRQTVVISMSELGKIVRMAEKESSTVKNDLTT